MFKSVPYIDKNQRSNSWLEFCFSRARPSIYQDQVHGMLHIVQSVIYYRVGLRAVWEFSQFLETSSLFDLPQDSSSIHIDIDNDLRHIPVILATLWTHQEVMTGDKPIVRPGVNSKYSNAQSFQFWAESVKFDNNTIIMWRIRNMPILLGPLQAAITAITPTILLPYTH